MDKDVAALVERLEQRRGSITSYGISHFGDTDAVKAASTIRALVAAVAQAEANSWSNVGQRERAEAAEAKLREAAKVVRDCVAALGGIRSDNVPQSVRAFLATMEKTNG